MNLERSQPLTVLLAVTRFHAFALQLKWYKPEAICEQDTFHQRLIQTLFVLKCQDVIQRASIASIPSTPNDFVLVMCENTLWAMPLEQLGLDGHGFQNESSDTAKKRKTEKECKSHDDIFADLLSQKERDNLKHIDHKRTAEEDTFSGNKVVNVQLNKKHRLLRFKGRILESICGHQFLVVLTEDQGLACIDVYSVNEGLEADKLSHVQSFSTGLMVSLFSYCLDQDFCPFPDKSLYLVIEKCVSDTTKLAKEEGSQSNLVYLPTCLFVLLFGRDAACLKSPVVLLCDSRGCVYTYPVKPHCSETEKLSVLCDMGASVKCIAQVIPDCDFALSGAGDKEMLIASLESALDGKRVTENKREKPSEGCVIISNKGECCLFWAGDRRDEHMFTFSLPHDVRSCTVKDDRIIYSTGEGIEICEVKLSRQENRSLKAAASRGHCLSRDASVHIAGQLKPFLYSKETMVVGVTRQLELFFLNTSEIKNQDLEKPNSSMDSIIQNTLSLSQDIQDVQNKISHMDSSITQLNLFSSILNHQSKSSPITQPQALEAVVSCDCSIVTASAGYGCINTLHVTLRNNTNLPITDAWKVYTEVHPHAHQAHIATEVSQETRHFVYSLSKGLAPKSSMDFQMPFTSYAGFDMLSHLVSVSLMLTNANCLCSTKQAAGTKQSMLVQIYQHLFGPLDCMRLTSTAQVSDISVQNCPHSLSLPISCRTIMEMGYNQAKITVNPPLKSQAYTMMVKVTDSFCKSHHLQAPEDVVRFLLGHEATASCPVHVQLRFPSGNRQISLAASAESQSNSFILTLRGEDFASLIEVRKSVKTKLQAQARLQPKVDNLCSELSEAEVYRKIQKYQKLLEDVRILQSQVRVSESQGKVLSENTSLLADLFDRCELCK